MRLGKGTSKDVEVSKSNEQLRKWREIQQTNNVPQRPEIYRSQKRKKPRFAARPYEYWCPDSESNQGHGDFQSPALPTELSRQMVGLAGLEPATSRLSGVRSNHLSYKP